MITPLSRRKDQRNNLLAVDDDPLQKRGMVWSWKLLVITALTALCGCVSPSSNGALRSGSELPSDARLVMATATTPRSAMQASVDQATQSALTRLGYKIAAKGEFVVDTAYSERPLGVSFKTDGSLHSAEAKLPNLAICTHRVQRLTLVVTDQRTGRPVYHGQAEITQCAGTNEDNAKRLADATLAKLPPIQIAP